MALRSLLISRLPLRNPSCHATVVFQVQFPYHSWSTGICPQSFHSLTKLFPCECLPNPTLSRVLPGSRVNTQIFRTPWTSQAFLSVPRLFLVSRQFFLQISSQDTLHSHGFNFTDFTNLSPLAGLDFLNKSQVLCSTWPHPYPGTMSPEWNIYLNRRKERKGKNYSVKLKTRLLYQYITPLYFPQTFPSFASVFSFLSHSHCTLAS